MASLGKVLVLCGRVMFGTYHMLGSVADCRFAIVDCRSTEGQEGAAKGGRRLGAGVDEGSKAALRAW